MVLADDNFATIVTATKEGRTIFENLKKFVLYLLSCNISEVVTILFAMLANLPVLYPIQILWTNLITDGLPALALGIDPAEPDLMSKPPRKLSEGVLSNRNLLYIFIQGLVISLGAISTLVISNSVFHADAAHSRTIVFTTLVFLQLFHSFNFRVGRNFYFSKSLFGNKYLLASFVLSALLQFAIIFIGPFNNIFKTVPLSINLIEELIICIVITILITNTIHRFFNKKAARNN
jgi:Ca2+-transporting ATPase